MTEPSNKRLAAALRTLGIEEMAQAADRGEYGDFSSPFPFPELKLVKDLATEATKYDDEQKVADIMALRRDVIDGKYDATQEESDAWAESPEGQEAFRSLVRKGPSDA